MLLFTLHGLFYAIAWTIEEHILDEVSANGVILFLVHSHIYTYVFLFSLYIYIIYSSFGKQTNIYIYTQKHAKRMQRKGKQQLKMEKWE